MGGANHGTTPAYCNRIPRTRAAVPGVPGYVFRHTQESLSQDLNALERVLKLNQLRGGTAAVLLEPIGPESGTRPLDIRFAAGCRALCDKYGALLIFDEVVTGFRVSAGGAQEYFGVLPDLTVFGKWLRAAIPVRGRWGAGQNS